MAIETFHAEVQFKDSDGKLLRTEFMQLSNKSGFDAAGDVAKYHGGKVASAWGNSDGTVGAWIRWPKKTYREKILIRRIRTATPLSAPVAAAEPKPLAEQKKEDAITVTLAEHGEFKSRRFNVEHAVRHFTKPQLVQCIVDAYAGSTDKLSTTKQHWNAYSKFVLAIVYAGMQQPLN
jgi:hypothetical protein